MFLRRVVNRPCQRPSRAFAAQDPVAMYRAPARTCSTWVDLVGIDADGGLFRHANARDLLGASARQSRAVSSRRRSRRLDPALGNLHRQLFD